jgi:DNA-binding response OmpR family regulator
VNGPRRIRRRSEPVKDAWIYPFDGGLGDALADQLVTLGYTPVRRPLEGSLEVERDVAAEAPPALVVIGTRLADAVRAAAICAQLRALDELHENPIMLALDAAAAAAEIPPAAGDDVLVAPWSVDELALRIARTVHRLGLAGDGDVVRIGGLEIDFVTYQVTIDGTPVDFTYMEYELLHFFVTHPNHVFSREALLSRVWGYDFYGETRTVDVHVRRVRAKLGIEHAARIRTVRSVGYRFER